MTNAFHANTHECTEAGSETGLVATDTLRNVSTLDTVSFST